MYEIKIIPIKPVSNIITVKIDAFNEELVHHTALTIIGFLVDFADLYVKQYPTGQYIAYTEQHTVIRFYYTKIEETIDKPSKGYWYGNNSKRYN